MSRRTEVILTIIGIVLACVTLLFGDNLFERITGQSVFPSMPSHTSTVIPFATEFPLDVPVSVSPTPSHQEVSSNTPVSPSPVPATPVPSSTSTYFSTVVSGNWKGEWSNSEGYFYTCELIIETMQSNIIDGYILWTLRKSPRASEQSKIGFTAKEYINGTYNPESQSVIFAGYKKDDPHNIIALDEYRLFLSDNATTLSGETENHGNWQGKLIANREP